MTMSGHTHIVHTPTYTQNNYSNPRCTCAPRVNKYCNPRACAPRVNYRSYKKAEILTFNFSIYLLSFKKVPVSRVYGWIDSYIHSAIFIFHSTKFLANTLS